MGEAALVSESPSYKRLTRADHTTILHLHDSGQTLSAIAERLGRSVSTIHEVVTTYQPTIDLAKRKLQASALDMAENIVRKGRAADHVKTLEGLDVLSAQDVKGNITIVVGGSAQVQVNIGLGEGGPALSPLAASAGSESDRNR